MRNSRLTYLLYAFAVFALGVFSPVSTYGGGDAISSAPDVVANAGAAKVEPTDFEDWYYCPGVGLIDFDGGEEVNDGAIGSFRMGFDYTETWSLEGIFYMAPQLTERTVGHTIVVNGQKVGFERISRSEESPGFGSTYAAALAVDGLCHFTRWERIDPYLAAGGGVTWYGKEVNGANLDAQVRAGAGVMYHFNDEWAVRADWRSLMVGNDSKANTVMDAGLMWFPGARIPPKPVAIGGPVDSDGDGLTDAEEKEWGTDAYDPDSDNDALSDGDEVHKYKTDPLNPDTDWDGLKDGEEVITYTTDPLLRDTDHGGVSDGHEVKEDSTNPLDPKDDLMLFTLDIKFDYDKAEIRPEWFPKLDVIGKVLRRHEGATARIEGHADQVNTKKRKSSKSYNEKLSKERAKAVLNYLADKHGIAKKNMTPIGHGFNKPKEKPDLVNGNPNNRRVEIYLRGAGNPKDVAGSDQSESAPDAVAAPAVPVATPAKADSVKPENK